MFADILIYSVPSLTTAGHLRKILSRLSMSFSSKSSKLAPMALDRDNTPSLRLGYPQLMAPQKVDPSSGGLQ